MPLERSMPVSSDEVWLRERMHQHGDALLKYLYALVGDAFVAEDLAQEAFWRLYRERQRQAQRPIRAGWLYTVARHLAMDYYRQRRREQPAARVSHDPGPHGDPDQRIVVETILERLPRNTRELLILFYWADWSVDDLAIHYGMSPAAVRGKLFRAREKFRVLWDREGEAVDADTREI